jgi:hypothetical protein
MPGLRGTGPVAGVALTLSLIAIIALVGIGMAAPEGVHPFFYIGLGLFGGGAFGLLLAGVGVVFARDRTPTVPVMDLRFFAGVRRLALAMWLFALVTDTLGALTLLAIVGGRGGTTPVSTGTLIVVFTAAAATVICAGVTSVVVRRLLPRG